MKINNISLNTLNRNQYNSRLTKGNSNNNQQRSEVVVVNRRTSFQAGKSTLPQLAIDRFGLNMECLVTKTPKEPFYVPAPDTLEKSVADYFHMLEVDWRTHVDPQKAKTKF